MQPTPVVHRPLSALQAGLDHIRAAPRDVGRVVMIVRRPRSGEREQLTAAELDTEEGLEGDNWRARGSRHTPDGSAQPAAQVTLMGSRAIACIAGAPERWPAAGDQLFVELDLSEAGLPAGSQLAVGEALLEVSALPHTGCGKFAVRYGKDALRFVNAAAGRALRLRGVNARVVRGGRVAVGDEVRRVDPEE